MAIYSTFFLCEPEELAVGFPGWQQPLPEPVTRTSINPFTREEITIFTRAPSWDDVDPSEFEMPEMHVVAIEGDYESYLEQRIPPFVQSQPHWCAKGLTPVELDPLVAAVTDGDDARLEAALYAHPSTGACLDRFPNEFLAQLANADDTARRSLAERWAAHMSTPKHTHSVSGKRLSEDWTVEDALSPLRPIADLVAKRTASQSMYLLVEF